MERATAREVGIDAERLERVFAVIEENARGGLLHGGAFLVARCGKIVAARGVGKAEPAKGRAARSDDVYCGFSTTKPLTATLILTQVERGLVRLFDRVAEYVPEFAAGGKGEVTVSQLLTHSAGFPNLAADWPIASWGDWDGTIARICAQPLEYEPGTAICYHALTKSWILGEIARRVDGRGRSFAQMCTEEIFEPLGMKDTHMGVRSDLAERRVPIQTIDKGGLPFPMEFLEAFNLPEVQRAAIPGGGAYTTVFDLARFYQMWLNGGELDGVRLLSPAMVELATTNHTGDMEDRFFDLLRYANRWPRMPANRGLGFFLRGSGLFPTYFGSLASPRTFGHPGASSVMAWADPARELVFVGLTSGLVFEDRHLRRFHALSDLVQSSVVD